MQKFMIAKYNLFENEIKMIQVEGILAFDALVNYAKEQGFTNNFKNMDEIQRAFFNANQIVEIQTIK